MKTMFFPKSVKHYFCEECGRCSEDSIRIEWCEKKHRQDRCDHQSFLYLPIFNDDSVVSVEAVCSACDSVLGIEHLHERELRWLYELLRERGGRL
jgi:hypothetical protein